MLSTQPHIAFVAEGDASTADCWSGSGRKFVEALRDAGARVDTYDAELKSWSRAAAAALTYHPARKRWQQRYGLGLVPFQVRSAKVNAALADAPNRYDAIVQIGATFAISAAARRGAPYVVYCDSNIAYALRGAPYSAASRLAPAEQESAFRREREVYETVDRIWTMSNSLAESFRTDFGQPQDKIATIYAGANNPPAPVPAVHREPRILFVGKDHERKGSRVLLEAFEIVRRALPQAELHLVGGIHLDGDHPGVVTHGFVSRSTPAGQHQFDHLFATASLLCLPSRYEPFGIAFLEAMHAGLACVGTDRWAMPEIIDHGRTGWLVPDGSVGELATVLINALLDPSQCVAMGALGRRRCLEQFTWDRTATRALNDLEAIATNHSSVEAAHAAI